VKAEKTLRVLVICEVDTLTIERYLIVFKRDCKKKKCQ
jgi:hypothetical protein